MTTIIFYNFILLSSTFFVWLSEKGRTSFDRRLLLGIAFLLVFIPAAIRYDVGTDYVNYLNIFENLARLEGYKYKEPAFYYINWLLRSIDVHFQWMFATFAFIFTLVAFKSYPRKKAWLLHFLFFSTLWFFSFNIMRQTVALSWCLLASFYFLKGRHFWFFIFTLIGATFHQSAFLILLVGILALIPLHTKLKVHILPIIFISSIILSYFYMDILLKYVEQTLIFLGLTKYANYLHSSHFAVRDFGSGLGILAKVLFSIYIIWNTKALLQLNKKHWLIILLTFIYAIGLVLADSIIIFGRMVDTFSIAPIVSAYLLSTIPTNRQINLLVLVIFLVFLTLSFIKLSFGIPTSYADPKRMPYQTIFTE